MYIWKILQLVFAVMEHGPSIHFRTVRTVYIAFGTVKTPGKWNRNSQEETLLNQGDGGPLQRFLHRAVQQLKMRREVSFLSP